METHTLSITEIGFITHNVKRFRLEKPEGYSYTPGQATEASVNRPGLREEKRPFTFTGLKEDPYLEFIIKIYDDHDGVTKALAELEKGDELIIGDSWGGDTLQGTG